MTPEEIRDTHLNDLPTIIDGPGEYVLRNGGRASVDEVKDNTQSIKDGTTMFAAKGSSWKMFRGKERPRGLDIWHVSGRRLALNEDPRDIVGKYTGE